MSEPDDRAPEQPTEAGIGELLRRSLLEVFAERRPELRRAAIERIFATDVRFSDPEASVVGHEALDRKAQGILDDAPDFVFAPAGPARVAQDLGYQAWTFGPAGAPAVVSGVDVALVEQGRIARLWTVLLND